MASIVHYPIKTPPRAFYCALPNQTPPRFSIVHFAAQGKKKLKSNVFYNSSPYGARVIRDVGTEAKSYFFGDLSLKRQPCSQDLSSFVVEKRDPGKEIAEKVLSMCQTKFDYKLSSSSVYNDLMQYEC